MILTCDKCQTKYMIASHAIGPEGRRVRCTKCNNEWFAEADLGEEEGLDDDDMGEPEVFDAADFEPIPEGVKPLDDGSNVQEETEPQSLSGMLYGYAAAAMVFFAVAGILVVLSKPVAHAWPATASVYEFVGIKIDAPGEGLIFDDVTAISVLNKDGLQMLNIKGKILNLRDHGVVVPSIRSSLRFADETEMDSWVFRTDTTYVDAEGEIEFETSYPEIPKDVKDVNLQFMLGRYEEHTVSTAGEGHHSEGHEAGSDHGEDSHPASSTTSGHSKEVLKSLKKSF